MYNIHIEYRLYVLPHNPFSQLLLNIVSLLIPTVYSDSNSPMHLLDAAGFWLQREVRNFDVSSKSCRSIGEIYTLDYKLCL